ncbi:hypothetical protein FNF31_05717 [Cafeteria roenbergensis]|uniref:Uncharacterized protein n=1 Tax=Cafeteria roenbergensis TaxID=33653 RepID=A0A5A8CYN0_CAFRO|nr:hypothetical protein FNF31_05717 [Cafeteria roenbergensis]
MCDVTNTNTNDLVGEWVEVVIRGSGASVEVLVAEVVPPSATLSTSGPVDAGDLVTTTVVVGHSGASNATAFGLTVRDAGLVAGGIVSGSARYSLLSVAVNGTAVPGASVGTSSWGFGDAGGGASAAACGVCVGGGVRGGDAGERGGRGDAAPQRVGDVAVAPHGGVAGAEHHRGLGLRGGADDPVPVVSVGVQTDDASPGNTTALRGQVVEYSVRVPIPEGVTASARVDWSAATSGWPGDALGDLSIVSVSSVVSGAR